MDVFSKILFFATFHSSIKKKKVKRREISELSSDFFRSKYVAGRKKNPDDPESHKKSWYAEG